MAIHRSQAGPEQRPLKSSHRGFTTVQVPLADELEFEHSHKWTAFCLTSLLSQPLLFIPVAEHVRSELER